MMTASIHRPTRRAAGFSLIELMVSMAIGLVITLAITSVMIRGEGNKRTTTSLNDLNQNAAFIGYTMERNISNAGSGFAQTWSQGAFGCKLDATLNNVHLMPKPTAWYTTSAFINVPLTFRLAPVMIYKSLANTAVEVRGDVIAVMGGQAGAAEMPFPMNPGSLTSSNFLMANSLGFRTGDLVLLMDTTVPNGCLLEQVQFSGTATGSSDPNIPLGGVYYNTSGTNVNLNNFGASTMVAQLGNPATSPPIFQLYAVGPTASLMTLDLLTAIPTTRTAPDVPLADGVVEMRAVYALDTTNPPNGTVDSYVDPVTTGWDYATLTNGSAASQAKLRQIVGIRLGFFLRTNLPEKASDYALKAGTALTLFSDLGLTQTRTLTTAELAYRWRTLEITIPFRNLQLAPQS